MVSILCTESRDSFTAVFILTEAVFGQPLFDPYYFIAGGALF
jgi:hypothetical protein